MTTDIARAIRNGETRPTREIADALDGAATRIESLVAENAYLQTALDGAIPRGQRLQEENERLRDRLKVTSALYQASALITHHNHSPGIYFEDCNNQDCKNSRAHRDLNRALLQPHDQP